MATAVPGAQPFPYPFGADLSHAPRAALPTMYDLPSEEPGDPGVPDEFHIFQPELLRDTFQPATYPREQVFVGCDLNLYYTLRNTSWYKRPDWFAALGVSDFYDGHGLRLSYVVWQEAAVPYLVIELLSPGKEQEDLGKSVWNAGEPPTKWMVYEQILGVPYYVVFNRYTDEGRYFQRQQGRYQEIHPPGQRLWLPEAGLGLGLWQGTYRHRERLWLRFYDAAGRWIPTPLEDERQQREQEQQRAERAERWVEQEHRQVEQERQRAEQERQRAEQERQRAEQAEQRAEQERRRAEQLAVRLKALGIDLE